MGKESMHQSVEVIVRKMEESQTADLHFPFFQMAYVLSGKGKLGINGNRIPYKRGNLMLLTPDDRHCFFVENPTEFLLVRFYTNYVKEYQWRSVDHMECLLYHASHLSGCILRNKADYPLARALAFSIQYGIQHEGIYNEDLIVNYVNALIVIAARNIAAIKPIAVNTHTDKRILDIIDYIQTHIFSPEALRAPVIAKQFGLSSTYLGVYFKEQCGETILHFISKYKIRLIEHRLQFSDQRVGEIALEFGFSDESHLNKFFKTHKQGVSLTGYRKKVGKKPAA
jgi:AraC-like DNA-binding protein